VAARTQSRTIGHDQKIRQFDTMRHLWQVFWNYRLRKREVVPYAPYRIWVEPTNRCNLSCVMCPNKDFRKSDLGFMDFQLYRRIIDEARDFVYDMNIHHRGESTLHPRLVEMIRYAKERGLPVKLHTNATTLTESLSRELIRSGLDLISFSFDGYTPEQYESVRVGARFDATLSRIHRFLDLKKEIGRQGPKTVMEIMELLDQPVEPAAKTSFLQDLTDRGLNRVIIKKPHNWAGNVDLKTKLDEVYSPCTFPWHAQVILWDGRVGPCPHDYMAKIILGDAGASSLRDIFNSSETRRLRHQMIQGSIEALEPPCSTCDTVHRRRILGVPVDSLKYLKE
jgi:radical SAM protein with 4Fe4S-binding SPASM domain